LRSTGVEYGRTSRPREVGAGATKRNLVQSRRLAMAHLVAEDVPRPRTTPSHNPLPWHPPCQRAGSVEPPEIQVRDSLGGTRCGWLALKLEDTPVYLGRYRREESVWVRSCEAEESAPQATVDPAREVDPHRGWWMTATDAIWNPPLRSVRCRSPGAYSTSHLTARLLLLFFTAGVAIRLASLEPRLGEGDVYSVEGM